VHRRTTLNAQWETKRLLESSVPSYWLHTDTTWIAQYVTNIIIEFSIMNLALHVMVNTPGAQLMSPGHTFNLAYGHLKTKAKQDTNLFNHTMRNVCQMYVIESNNDHIITLVE